MTEKQSGCPNMHDPEDWSRGGECFCDELAAAEERGRRRGDAERDELREFFAERSARCGELERQRNAADTVADELRALLKEWLPRQCALKPWPQIGSMLACGKCLGCRTLIALAPRDSAPACVGPPSCLKSASPLNVHGIRCPARGDRK